MRNIFFKKILETKLNLYFSGVIFLLILFFGLFGLAKNSQADVTLPWSTTYNCAEWKTTDGADTHCDNMVKYGDVTCNPGSYEEQITSIANNPNGGGGGGQRHWEGDGTNVLSGGTRIDFATAQPEVWIRWYLRFPLGFSWNSNQPEDQKMLYFRTDTGTAPYVGIYYQKCRVVAGGVNYASADGTGWSSIMGGSTGDGLWHYYEVHMKVDTNGINGIAEMWVDGVLKLSYANVDYNTPAVGFTWFTIGNNQKIPTNGQCVPVDYDDVAVNNTGYIGPIGATPDVTPPAAPSGLSVS
jgi:hypothetical protein